MTVVVIKRHKKKENVPVVRNSRAHSYSVAKAREDGAAGMIANIFFKMAHPNSDFETNEQEQPTS